MVDGLRSMCITVITDLYKWVSKQVVALMSGIYCFVRGTCNLIAETTNL